MYERRDLQRLLREHIEVIAPDTLVIDEEFGDWEEPRRRIDLLAIDKNGKLVVVELKRTEDGEHMELQSIRHASMVSTLTFDRAVDFFARYLTPQISVNAQPIKLLKGEAVSTGTAGFVTTMNWFTPMARPLPSQTNGAGQLGTKL